MKVKLYTHKTLKIDLSQLLEGLKSIAPSYEWSTGDISFKLDSRYISYPKTYRVLDERLLAEIKNDDCAFIFTGHPYDNNYFWDSGSEKVTIVSLYGWNQLTDLPRSNGAVYFIIALLVQKVGIGNTHREKNTGCINDFWQDKSGVDTGMRAAFLCGDCLSERQGTHGGLTDVKLRELISVLDDLSKASRANEDILSL